MSTNWDKFDEALWKAIKKDWIYKHYQEIMLKEAELAQGYWDILSANEAFHTAEQIENFAQASTVIRSYHKRYDLTAASMAFESDGAHTNLMSAMVDRALSLIYGPEVHFTEDGYTYREVMEAVRRHDLPENITGDIPDDGTRDEAAKVQFEQEFQRKFSSHSPSREVDFEKKVLRLLAEMEGKTSPTGKLLYVADKVSATLMVLCYEKIGHYPRCLAEDPLNTERERRAIEICDTETSYGYHTSEIWAIDYFKLRKLIRYDETGFFTALIVMMTLKIRGQWYSWREADYLKNNQT